LSLYSSNTVEARTTRPMSPAYGPRQGCPKNDRPLPRRKAAWSRVFPFQHMTATEVVMSQEREYRESQLYDRDRAISETGQDNVKGYYNAIRNMMYIKGVVMGAKEHVKMLENFDAPDGNMYYSEKDEFFVDNWSIKTPEIYHRHKELGTYMTMDGMGFKSYHAPDSEVIKDHYKTHIMWDAAKGECGLCGEHMPGEIMMMHLFYQF